MSPTLLVTPAEMAAGWVVRPGMPCPSPRSCPPLTRQMCRYGGVHPPADLLAAAAPCETCHNTSGTTVPAAEHGESPFPRFILYSCPDCLITLLGECPECRGTLLDMSDPITAWYYYGIPEPGSWPLCEHCDTGDGPTGTVILGYAYPVGDVLPIVAHDVDFPGPCIVAWHREPMSPYVFFAAEPAVGVVIELVLPRLAGLGQYALQIDIIP